MAPDTAPLTRDEAALAKRLVREGLRKQQKNLVGLIRKWGGEADLAQTLESIERHKSLYRKLGGDPDRITNMPTQPQTDSGDAAEGATA